MRSSVYLKTSDIASARPDHECSQDLAKQVIAARFARPIGRNTIQLVVEESWQWVKAQVRSISAGMSYQRAKMRYEHHLEPKLETMTLTNSPWLRYLHGWNEFSHVES